MLVIVIFLFIPSRVFASALRALCGKRRTLISHQRISPFVAGPQHQQMIPMFAHSIAALTSSVVGLKFCLFINRCWFQIAMAPLIVMNIVSTPLY